MEIKNQKMSLPPLKRVMVGDSDRLVFQSGADERTWTQVIAPREGEIYSSQEFYSTTGSNQIIGTTDERALGETQVTLTIPGYGYVIRAYGSVTFQAPSGGGGGANNAFYFRFKRDGVTKVRSDGATGGADKSCNCTIDCIDQPSAGPGTYNCEFTIQSPDTVNGAIKPNNRITFEVVYMPNFVKTKPTTWTLSTPN